MPEAYSAPPSPKSPKDLYDALKKVQEKGEQLVEDQAKLVEDQAKNKRELTNLTRFLGVIEQNIADFKKSGHQIGNEFKLAKKEVSDKLICVTQRLKEAKDAVETAFNGVFTAITGTETDLLDREMTIAGPLDLAARNAKRKSDKSQKAFEALRVNDLKGQLGKAREYVKSADSIVGTSTAESAVAYAWLKLAADTLDYQWLITEFESEKAPFTFPKDNHDYETRLVEAFAAMDSDLETAVVAQAAFDKANAEFDSEKKSLPTQRATRDKDAVKAATDAVKPHTAQVPVSPQPELAAQPN